MNSLASNIKIVINGDIQIYSALPGDTVPPYFSDDELLGEIVKQKPEITYNIERTYKSGKKAPNGIEIRFGTARPIEAVRQELKDHGFQFSERQTMWYAIDNDKSRALTEKWADQEVEVDTTQYEKRNFWARVSSMQDYDRLRERTEFYIKAEPPKNFYSKSYLQRAYNISDLIHSNSLYFKKFYNKIVGEEEPDNDSPSNNEPGSEVPDNKQDHLAIAEKLQSLADGMQREIDSKINSAISRQRPTAKRVRIAAGLREEGYRLLDIQKVLYALAETHRTEIPDDFLYLKNIRSKSQVALLNQYAIAIKEKYSRDYIETLYNNNWESLQTININSVYEWERAEKQKQELLKRFSNNNQSKYNENQKRIKELEDQAWKQNIPGFFPTPRPLIDRALDMADITEGHSILEPSAGKGDILDAITERFSDYSLDLYAAEVNNTLREILILKGYDLVASDFLDMDGKYDRIVMNPPFENGQDVHHVSHALKLLKPNGRVIAIMSEGVFFRPFKKDVAFRKLLMDKNAYISEPIKEAFKNAFNTASATVRIVAINADGTPIVTGQSSTESDSTENINHKNEDMELLQLEAEAELELLKMRVELERKRKQRTVEGIPGIDPDKLQSFRKKAWALQNNVEILDFN